MAFSASAEARVGLATYGQGEVAPNFVNQVLLEQPYGVRHMSMAVFVHKHRADLLPQKPSGPQSQRYFLPDPFWEKGRLSI